MTPIANIIKNFFRERVIITMILAVAIVAAVRPVLTVEYFSGVSPDRYWADKLNWRHCADVVLAGDSRVYINVAPRSLTESLSVRRIYNFGFSNNAWSAEYLTALEQVLDPHSPAPMIVLGLNPYSLTHEALTNNKFADMSNRRYASNIIPSQAAVLCNRFKLSDFFGGCLAWVEPLPVWELLSDVCRGRTTPKWYNEYYSDGWVACDREPADPTLLLATSRFVLSYQNNPVDPKLTDLLIQHVRKWRNQGIEVYGFRPPVYRDVLTEETRLSGFDEAEFVRGFESAGGVWLTIDNDKYGGLTYDGHHLPRRVAVEYTRDLGSHIISWQLHKKTETF
jgi:hypothetical protein